MGESLRSSGFAGADTMHIVIDGRTIVRNRTGVGVYADRLVRSLLQVDQRNNYSIFLVEDDPTLVAPNLKKILIDSYDRMGPNRFWENFVLPKYLKENNADIYFSPGYLLPLLIRSADASRRSRRPG